MCISDSVCDFEKGLCGWSNTQNSSVDLLDWDLTSVQAEKFYSTPPYDHTLYTEEGDLCSKLIKFLSPAPFWGTRSNLVSFVTLGHFMVLPNSQRDTANQNAWLLSPHLAPTKGTCLSFWVYQPTMCMYKCSHLSCLLPKLISMSVTMFVQKFGIMKFFFV